MTLSGNTAEKHIESLKQDYRDLLMTGYKDGGSLEHGARVNAAKARALVAMEEFRFFSVVTK